MIARERSLPKREDTMRALFGALAVAAVLAGSACSQPYGGYGDPGYGSGYGYAAPGPPAYGGYGDPGYASPPYGDRDDRRRDRGFDEQRRREEEEAGRARAEQQERGAERGRGAEQGRQQQQQTQDRQRTLNELRARLPH
jgi:hypothetical protein